MKTKNLIQELQRLDPTGEVEVVVDGADIFSTQRMPAYYDGRLGVLIRGEGGCVEGIKFYSKGDKINLHLRSLEDVVWDQDAPGEARIEYDSLSTEEAMRAWVERVERDFKVWMEDDNGEDKGKGNCAT